VTTTVAVKIRLKRLGKIRAPHYRIVVADSRTKRDGRAIEEIGLYQPTQEPSLIEVDSARAQYWLGVGAQPTEQVLALLKITGDWQKHKGLPGQEGTLRVAAPKADKKAVFEAAAKEGDGGGEAKGGATTPRARKAAKAAPAASPAPEAVAEPAAEAVAEPAAEAVAEPAAEAVAEPAAEAVAEPSADEPADAQGEA
jgi:small subunit ribosomal protein S16